MLNNQWYAILESKELTNKILGLTRFGEKLVVFREGDGHVVCLSDICSHRHASLAFGKIKENHVQCPFHGLEYDRSGKCVLIPANGVNAPIPETFRQKSYPCRERNGFIFAWYSTDFPIVEPSEGPTFFDDLDEKSGFTYCTIRDHWHCHYTRGIENQLDMAHLPFVHHNTIGRGHATVVDGPDVEWISNKQMNVYVHNRKDDGSPAKKPNEMGIPHDNTQVHLELIMPNIWQNRINDNMRVMAAFVPIDEENSLMYFRYYQNFVRIPLVRNLVSYGGYLYSKIVERQDKRVVQTQDPKRFRPQTEHWLMGDRALVEFLKKSREMGGE